MKLLDLFSGIGGFSLGLERAGFETAVLCEVEEYPRKILRQHWAHIPIAHDVRELNYKDGVLYEGESPIYTGRIDAISAGYPCQPESVAGKQKSDKDDRWLWKGVFRLIKQAKPDIFFGENVANHANLSLDRVLFDLEAQGYACGTFIIPACAIGLPHRRERVWIVAYTDRVRLQTPWTEQLTTRLEQHRKLGWKEWEAKPVLCRKDDGLPHRVDRIKALGNSIVPDIAEILGKCFKLQPDGL